MVELTRSTLALVVGATVFAVVLAGALVVFGLVSDAGGNHDDEIPYAGFEFEERNITIPSVDAESNRTAVLITYQSGMDLAQTDVSVEVNGEPAWNLEYRESEGNYTAYVWNSSNDPISEDAARIIVYGEDAESVEIDAEDGLDQLQFLAEGDIVEIVWRESDGERMTVLQRYVVGAD